MRRAVLPLLGILFALIVLPFGRTQETIATLLICLIIIWLVTAPVRWKDGD
jgi:hypothetical protein